MENKKDYNYPWGYDYDGDSGTGMIKPPPFPGGGVDEDELNNAIDTAVNKLVNNAPASLDTLGEIADALENDESVTAALVNSIAGKVSQEEYDADKANFATKDEIPTVPTKLSELENDSDFVTEDALSAYAKSEDVYTKTEADEKFLTEHQDISNLATKQEVEELGNKIPTKVSELENDTEFITEAALAPYAESENVYTKTEADEKFLTEHQDISNLATKDELEAVENEIPTALSQLENDADFITTAATEEKIATATEGMATQQWVEDKNYLTEHQSLEDYVKKEELAEVATSGEYDDLKNKPENVSVFNNDAGYLTEHQSLADYINGVDYDSESKKIEFKHDDNVLATVDTTDFIKDGMVQSVEISNGNLVITFNTDAGKEPISIALTDIFNPANYYTKAETDAKLAEKANLSDLAEVATSGEYGDLKNKPENVSVFNNDAGYLTEHQSLADYATKTEVENGDNATLTNILSRIWSNTNKEVSGYFKTRFTNPDGSYAQIWNESDGGGSLYENKAAGIKTYVGVNADGADGVCAQIYSKNVSSNVGSRLNVNPNGIFYGIGSSASMLPEEEIAVKGDIASAVDGLASVDDIPTKVSELENDANYLTEHQSLSDYVKKEELATVATTGSYTDLENTPENVSEFNNDAGYLTEHQSLDAYINSVSYDANEKEIVFKHGDNVLATIDATPFIKDGMVNSVAIDGGNLVITFNTDAGKEPISIALSDIFNPASYYTKDEVDTQFATKTESVNGDNEVLTNILGRMWSNTNKEVSGYFKTRYTNADGSYAQIWNESDGGGSLYENKTANIKSFVGVNADGADGICVQIYSKNVSSNVGSRLNVNPNGIFYGVGSSASTDAGTELAVKNDIAADRAEVDAIIAEKDATIASLKDEVYALKQAVGNIGGDVTYYMPGDGKTFSALMNNNGTVKLTEDVTTSRFGPGRFASNTTTLNLNNHTLTINPTDDYASLLIRGSQNITIKDSGLYGTIINESNSKIVWASDENAVVNIQKGNFIGAGNGSEVIYCEKGTINISGGTFRNSYEDKTFILNCLDTSYKNGTAKIIVTGGKFYDFDPGNNLAEGPNTSFLAEGYHTEASTVIEEGVEYTVYTVKKD